MVESPIRITPAVLPERAYDTVTIKSYDGRTFYDFSSALKQAIIMNGSCVNNSSRDMRWGIIFYEANKVLHTIYLPAPYYSCTLVDGHMIPVNLNFQRFLQREFPFLI